MYNGVISPVYLLYIFHLVMNCEGAMSQYLTLEMIRAERARRARVRELERSRVKSMLRVLPGGAAGKEKASECESVGNCEQTSTE